MSKTGTVISGIAGFATGRGGMAAGAGAARSTGASIGWSTALAAMSADGGAPCDAGLGNGGPSCGPDPRRGTAGGDATAAPAAPAPARAPVIAKADAGGKPTDSSSKGGAALTPSAETSITPPQTEQRARVPVFGTLVGSTRNTDRHSGQTTFTRPLQHWLARSGARPAGVRPRHPAVGRPCRPTRSASSRSSSSRSPTHSFARRA